MPATYKRQLKGAVLARIALGVPSALATGHATTSGVGFAAKVVVGLALVGSLGAGAYRILRAPRRPTEIATRYGAAAPPSRAPVEDVSEPVVPTSETASSSRVKRVAEREAPRADPDTLARETALLREADRALRAGDTATAIAALEKHAALFPKGALAPERVAERLIVSCRVGDADAHAVARFLAASPGAPLAARVKRACAPPPARTPGE
jgi:hypothetical protein